MQGLRTMDEVEQEPDQEELALVERLWRSGSSATAISPSTRNDDTLLTRLLTSRDRTAAVPMLRRHRVATWRFAAVVTLDVTRADAAVEATWRELLGEGVTPIGTWTNPRAWLFATARRHALDLGAAPGTELDLDDTAAMPFDPTGDVALMAASLCLLEEPARSAVWLHSVEGLSDPDIAFVLDIERMDANHLVDEAMADLRISALRGQRAVATARCQPALDAFAPYLDQTLDVSEERDLLDHVGRCRRCAARLDALEAPGLSLIDRVLAPPAGLTARLRELAAAH